SAIFLKRQHPIIPPTKQTAFGIMDAKGIAQIDLFERAKSGAFSLRTHNGAAPKAGIMHITIFRRDIEISAHNYVRKRFLRLRDAIAQLSEPLQFVIERSRADRLSIRCVNGKNAHVLDRCRDHSCLRIFAYIAQRGLGFPQLVPGKNRNAVVRFLAVKDAAITCRCECQLGKLIIAALCFLQANDIWLFFRQPIKQTLLALAQRVDVPGGDFHLIWPSSRAQVEGSRYVTLKPTPRDPSTDARDDRIVITIRTALREWERSHRNPAVVQITAPASIPPPADRRARAEFSSARLLPRRQ